MLLCFVVCLTLVASFFLLHLSLTCIHLHVPAIVLLPHVRQGSSGDREDTGGVFEVCLPIHVMGCGVCVREELWL